MAMPAVSFGSKTPSIVSVRRPFRFGRKMVKAGGELPELKGHQVQDRFDIACSAVQLGRPGRTLVFDGVRVQQVLDRS